MVESLLDLSGKKYLVVGVANDKSLAWGIAGALQSCGATLGFTYLNEALEKRVRPLADSINAELVLPCNVQSDSDIDELVASVQSAWGHIDGIIHSVAYAEREDLQGRFSETSRSGFNTALDISAYSLVSLVGKCLPLMKGRDASVVTLTYLGSERVVSNYKVMGVAKAALEASVRYLADDIGADGVRVNAISAGPVRTLAASGIPKFRDMLSHFSEVAPLRRTVTAEDVGRSALYLLSPLSSAVTGEVIYVDCGYNIMGS